MHHANEDHGLEVYRFLRDDLGAEFIQLIPIVELPSPGGIPTGSDVTERSVSPEGYGRFLIEVFDEWVRHDVGRVFVQMFDSTLASFVGVAGSLCVHAVTCGTALALEHNGDLYSCDHFVEPEYLLGNITAAPADRARRHLRSRRPSATPSATRFPRTAARATCASPATAAARRTGSPRPRTASPGCTTCARATRPSSGTSTSPCASWPRSSRSGGYADAVMDWVRRDPPRPARS